MQVAGKISLQKILFMPIHFSTELYLGKADYIEAASRFFSTTSSVELKRIVIDGDNVVVVARYTVTAPHGQTQKFDVAEFLTVKGGMLASSAIFFDSLSLADFMAGKNT